MSDTNPPQRLCPQCTKQVDLMARFCKYCAFELPPPAKTVEGRFETVTPVPQSSSIKLSLIFMAMIALLGSAIYVVNTREGAKNTFANVNVPSPAVPANYESSTASRYQPESNSVNMPADPPPSAVVANVQPEQDNYPEKQASRYIVKVYNVDDYVVLYVNNSQILRVEYNKTGEIDITDKLRSGNNDVRFLVMNTGGGYTYGIEILEDGRTYFQDSCGKVRTQGCAGESSRYGNVFDQTVSIVRK